MVTLRRQVNYSLVYIAGSRTVRDIYRDVRSQTKSNQLWHQLWKLVWSAEANSTDTVGRASKNPVTWESTINQFSSDINLFWNPLAFFEAKLSCRTLVKAWMCTWKYAHRLMKTNELTVQLIDFFFSSPKTKGLINTNSYCHYTKYLLKLTSYFKNDFGILF